MPGCCILSHGLEDCGICLDVPPAAVPPHEAGTPEEDEIDDVALVVKTGPSPFLELFKFCPMQGEPLGIGFAAESAVEV